MTKYLLIAIGILILTNAITGRYALYLNDQLVTEKNNNAVLTETLKNEKDNARKANEISKQYQQRLSIVDSQLDAIRLRNKSSVCITVTDGKRRPNDATTAEVVSGGNGRGDLSGDWLYSFAGRCERERLKVEGLQNHIREFNQ